MKDLRRAERGYGLPTHGWFGESAYRGMTQVAYVSRTGVGVSVFPGMWRLILAR